MACSEVTQRSMSSPGSFSAQICTRPSRCETSRRTAPAPRLHRRPDTARWTSSRIGDMNLRQELIGVLVIERQGNTDQDRRYKEHHKVLVPQQAQCIKTQDVPEARLFLGLGQGRRARQREAVDAERN